MKYIWKYKTPEGFDDLVMSGDGEALTGLWFAGSRDAVRRGAAVELRETPVFRETCRWLDEYFAGRDPGFTPNYRIEDLTEFRAEVIDELKRIPFGATVSYGDIAKAISKKHGGAKVSARAVGGAVGWNPIGIIIPCHRVIGADNGLTGYGGGLGNKISLLAHEGSDLFDVRLSAPKDRKDEIDGVFVRRCIQAVNRAAALHGLGRARCEENDGTTILLDALTDGWVSLPRLLSSTSAAMTTQSCCLRVLLISDLFTNTISRFSFRVCWQGEACSSGRGWDAFLQRPTGVRMALTDFCSRISRRGRGVTRSFADF